MPRTNHIRWRNEDKIKLSRLVGRFNAKITRTLKAHPELEAYLPERLHVASVRGTIQSRADYNRIIRQYERFLRKGMESPITTPGGLRTTKWELGEMKIQLRRINAIRKKKREESGSSIYKGTMGTEEQRGLQPKRVNFAKQSEASWKRLKESFEKQLRPDYFSERAIQYKQNYIVAINQNLRNTSKYMEIITKIQNSDPQFLYDVYYNDPVLQIDFIYDPIEAEMKANEIYERLGSYGL